MFTSPEPVESSMNDRAYTEKLWGCEELIVNDPAVGYCGKLLWLLPDHCGSLHYHNVKDETFMCVEGVVGVEYFPVTSPHLRKLTVLRGVARDALRLRPGVAHRFVALEGPAILVEFSTPHSDEDVVRIEASK